MTKKLSFMLLILLILLSITDSFKSHRPFRTQRFYSSNLQANDCTYQGGKINNSTVIELGNCYNYFYFIGLDIGTEGQYFNFQIDTGSPTFWIPQGTNPTGFEVNASMTCKITNQSNGITYGDGTQVSGLMGSDIVSIPQTPIKTNYSILFANSSNVTFENSNVYGLIGMDFKSYPNFIDLSYQRNLISSDVFALQLHNPSQMSLFYYNNGLNSTVMKNTAWIPLSDTSQFWQLDLLSFSIGGIDMTDQASNNLIVDSGTTIIAINQELFDSIVETSFTDPSCYIYEGSPACNCNIVWPDMAFMLNGVVLYVPGSEAIFDLGNGTCQYQISVSPQDQIIVGDTFFRQYIISFDRQNQRVGFYGNYRILNMIDPKYFTLIQYILGGVGIVLSFVGIGLWIFIKFSFEKKLQSNLGTELMKY